MARTGGVVAVAALLLGSACSGGRAERAEPAPTAAPAATPTIPEPTPTPAPTATPTPSPTPSPTPTPTPGPLECVAGLPLRTRLGQLLAPLAVQAEMGRATELAAAGELGGITLLGAPGATIADDLAALQASSAIPLIVAVDEEGGRVQRLAGLLGPIPSARQLALTVDPVEAGSVMRPHAAAVAELGFTMILAPVVDTGGGPAIGDRSYSDDPAVVVPYAAATRDAILDAGLVPVLKHFPGHGRASADSHLTAATTPAFEELSAVDLVPYLELLDGSPAVMVGHLDVPGLTEGVPATLSPEAIDGLLREELGFEGLVLTDALDMGAISQRWPATTAAELSLQAGADVLLLGSLAEVVPVIDHLEQAVAEGALTVDVIDDSVVRVLAAKGLDPCATISP